MEINVTTFHNPHLFWFFELKHNKERELIENELSKEKPLPLSRVEIGEVVAVFDGKWKRAVVKSTNSPYTCWLLDYGIQHQAKALRKVSDENANKLPLAKQGALINTVCLEQAHSVSGIRNIEKLNFTPGCIKRAQDYLDTADKLSFSCAKEINNLHLGTLTVTFSNATFDLTEMLIKDKVLMRDENLFQSALSKNHKVDMDLKSLPCMSQLVSFEQDFTVSGIGRGINRKSQQGIRNRSTKKAALEDWVQQSKLSANKETFDSDEDFCDATDDSSSSASKNHTQTLSFKHLKQAYADPDTSSKDSEDCDLITSVRNEKKLKNHMNACKKSNKINWKDFKSDTTSSNVSHLNIPPSGMLLSKPSKAVKNTEARKRSVVSTSKEVIVPAKQKSSASESTKDTKEEVPKMSVAGCKCEQCVGWDGDDLYFNENKKHFQDTEFGRKAKEVVKPLLLLKEEDAEGAKIKSCVTLSNTKIKRSVAPTVLVHGSTFLSPVTSLSAVPFHADIHRALRMFEHVYSVQTYVWPALMRHMNICIIGNRNSGKTMAYLPGICSFELERKERYPDLPQNTISPITVILCEGVQTAEKIFNTILKLLSNASGTTYVALAVPPIDKKCLNQFQKQVHILVATPKTLSSLIATRIITLKRLCHLIVEDVDLVLERFPQDVDSLLKLIQSVLLHRCCNYTVQVVVTAERWTVPIEALLKSLVMTPVVCITSYLEAAFYGRVDLQLHFVEAKVKMATLSNFLKGKSDICRTVVICNTSEEMNSVKEFLLFAGINCLFITDDMESKDILDVESRWLHSSAGKHLALICEEGVFSHSINITNAVLLVHYSLPETWTQFVDRFKCLIDNYVSPLTSNTSDDWTRCKTYIFVDESCSKQFPKIVQVMGRLGAKLPHNFQKYHQDIIRTDENAKITAKIKMCNYLKLLGRCTSLHCKNRHFLSKDLDYVGNLPKNGLIKFKIVRVHNVTCFAIQLLEHTDVKGETTKFDLNDDFEKRLMDAMKEQRTAVFDAKPGGRYAYHSVDDKKYYRCTVRKLVSVEKITKKAVVVSIRCLDTGLEVDVPCSVLYELPQSLAKVHPKVTDVYLANMVPPDSDTAWSYYSKTKVDKILQDADYEKENTYAIGQIQLQLGNIMWLKNMMVYEVLKSTNLTVNKLNVRKRLLDEGLAVVNEAQLEGLYEACADACIELPDYNLPTKDLEIRLINQARPEWSYFDDSEYTEIYIAYVETPSLFYVRLKKFYDLFLNLQKEIQETIAKPFYPPVTDVCLDRCYLAKDPEGDDYARVIVKDITGDFINVFFVDYGDYSTLEKAELKHLPDELITKLPFQVIECRLYGVEPINAQWDLTAIHKFFDFVFEPNTDFFRTLYTTSCKQEPSTVTGGMKYSVLLVDNFKDDFVIVNQLLIDVEEAVPIENEDINVEFSLPQAEEEQADAVSDIEDKEMTIEEIKKLREKHAPKVEVIEAACIDDEPTWDIEINDAEMFIKKFISRDSDAPSTSMRNNWDLPPLQALPPSAHSTPNVLWHQTDSEVRINIMLPNIGHCDLQVLRGKLLIFSTTYNGKLYKLNMNFFDQVEKTFQYTLGGPHIKVSLKKKATAEWPRLIVSTQKMRFIKYDFTRCAYEEEKTKRFLDLGLEDDDGNLEGGVVHEIGSDDNYSESDYESDFED